MMWFTSDWHIGHDKPFIYEKRGFLDIYTHDTAILKLCNKFVQPTDELWILGDLALGRDESEWDRIFYNINCQNVHFIQGNHDSDSRVDKYTDEYRFEYHGYVDLIKYNKHKIFYLSHYPTITDSFDTTKSRPTINLYGHTHQTTNFYDNHLMYHVGVDSHNMCPVSLKQIMIDLERESLKYI